MYGTPYEPHHTDMDSLDVLVNYTRRGRRGSRQQPFFDVPGGDTMVCDAVNCDGYRVCNHGYPPLTVQENFERTTNNTPLRDDDILLCSYPASGRTWLKDMLNLVLTNQTEWKLSENTEGILDIPDWELLEPMKSPRILCTHMKADFIPKDAYNIHIKTILLVRNPKDVAVSYYNLARGTQIYEYDGKFENFLQMFMRGDAPYGSYADYLQEWQGIINTNKTWPIKVVYYEDMVQDTVATLRRVCEFLGRSVSDDILQKIVNSCEFSKMKAQYKDSEKKKHEDGLITKYKQGYCPVRRGTVGSYTELFTPDTEEKFDEWWKKKTHDMDLYKFKYAA